MDEPVLPFFLVAASLLPGWRIRAPRVEFRP